MKRQPNGVRPKAYSPSAIVHLPTGGCTTNAGAVLEDVERAPVRAVAGEDLRRWRRRRTAARCPSAAATARPSCSTSRRTRRRAGGRGRQKRRMPPKIVMPSVTSHEIARSSGIAGAQPVGEGGSGAAAGRARGGCRGALRLEGRRHPHSIRTWQADARGRCPNDARVLGTPGAGRHADRTTRTTPPAPPRPELATADVVAAEDTRRTAPPRGRPRRGHRRPGRLLLRRRRAPAAARAARALEAGRRVLLVTDAGMPSVSDPGYRLVAAAVEAGLPVTAVPGPSAVLTALALVGAARWTGSPSRGSCRARAGSGVGPSPRSRPTRARWSSSRPRTASRRRSPPWPR